MQHEFIASQEELDRFCQSARGASAIAFDTEFVSEDRYRPELCLVQVAAAGRYAIIDPLAVRDMTPFWELLASGTRTTIAHAARQELCFCLEGIGKRPATLFDTQIAAGMIGMEYPAAYSTLVQKLTGKVLGKGETRSDWRRRPLTSRQLEYAVRDVMYLGEVRDAIDQRMEELGRSEWFRDEMEHWQLQVEQFEYTDRWRRLPGVSSLAPQGLAIARELWLWRDSQAQQLDRPPRRILRDDLIGELAKRGSADVGSVKGIRGMNYRDKSRYVEDIAACIQRVLRMPPDQWPQPLPRKGGRPRLGLLGQFLATALSSVCHAQEIAPSLVGTVDDVRDLIAYHLQLDGAGADTPPALARGWRSQVVGRTIQDVLAGKLAIRVGDPLGDHPLVISPEGG